MRKIAQTSLWIVNYNKRNKQNKKLFLRNIAFGFLRKSAQSSLRIVLRNMRKIKSMGKI